MNAKKWQMMVMCVTLSLAASGVSAQENAVEKPLASGELYRASAWLWVPKTRPKIMYEVESPQHYLTDRDALPFLIRSPIILDTAVQELGIAELNSLKDIEGHSKKVAWLAEHLEVGFLGESEILEIAITGSDPEELKTILLAVRQAYMDRVVAVSRELDMRRRMTLEQVYKNMEKMLARKRIQYRTLKEQLETPDSSSTSCWHPRYPVSSVDEISSQLIQRIPLHAGLRQKRDTLQSRLKEIPEQDATLEQTARAEQLREEIDRTTLDLDVCQAEVDALMKLLVPAQAHKDIAEKNADDSVELDALKGEIDHMMQMYREMSRQLYEWTIESQAPARVQAIMEPRVTKAK